MSTALRMDAHDDDSARSYFLYDTSSPTDVGRASFPLVRRGYDPIEVQGFARAVASELERLHLTIGDLREALADAEHRADVGVDEDLVLQYLGEESARLLADARSTAQQVKARAEDNSARVVAEAEAEANSIRAEARTYASDITAAADQRSTATTRDAESRAEKLLASTTTESKGILQMARDQAADLVADAEKRRADVLADLHARRVELEGQIARQLASRDRIHELVGRVRALADDALDEFEQVAQRTEPYVGTEDEIGEITIVS